MLVFEEKGNWSTQKKKTSQCSRENQQTQPTYDPRSGNQTRVTLVGGECSHHCAIPTPPNNYGYYMASSVNRQDEPNPVL